MSFDRLAPHYRWMEAVLAGRVMQRCRLAWLGEVRNCRNVLVAGVGPGRFVEQALRVMPEARFTCVDASRAMLARASAAAEKAGGTARVRFVHAALPEWKPEPLAHDLIVTHFFLDCFPEPALSEVVARLASGAKADARWLLADFQIPERGLRRLRARMVLALAYRFFRITTALPASRIFPPDDALRANGFHMQRTMTANWSLLHSDLWSRACG
jgi:SAM-dependent methyltransferase